MKKHDLREQGFSVGEIFPKRRKINILWLVFTLLMITGTYIALTAIIGYSPNRAGNSPIDINVDAGNIPLYFIELIVCVFLYFGLKLVAALIFCKDKNNSTKLKTLEDKSLPIFPVCFCREAFKVWQTVVMYLAPAVLVYAIMFILCMSPPAFDEVDAGYMTMLFFMLFFMAFDITLIAYVLYFKVKNKINYISVEYHIYGVTLYKKTYVKFNRKPGKYLKTNSKYIDEGKFRF